MVSDNLEEVNGASGNRFSAWFIFRGVSEVFRIFLGGFQGGFKGFQKVRGLPFLKISENPLKTDGNLLKTSENHLNPPGGMSMERGKRGDRGQNASKTTRNTSLKILGNLLKTSENPLRIFPVKSV